MDPRVIVVAAIADNSVIGRDGGLPWHLKSDLKRFKTLTEGGTVVMGRKTHESIVARLGKPLPNRLNLVLTTDPDYRASGCLVENSLKKALEMLRRKDSNIFIIGGASVYREALWLADELHLTHVHAEPAGDVRFPDGIDERFVKTDACRFPADRENDHDYTFAVYHKVLPEPGYVNLDNARKPEQWAVMERILLDGVCPFCPQHLAVYHKVTVIRENAYWVLTKNQWPYENTRIHLLIIAKRHWQTLSDIRPAAWVELGEMVASVESEHLITGGGLGLRFGDPRKNGGTVSHLHWQLLAADTVNPADPGYKKVRLSLS